MADNFEERSNVAQYVLKRFMEYSTDRAPLEEKWENNQAAYNKTLDTSPKKAGEAGKDGEQWRSSTFVGITKQKVVAAVSIIIDTVLQGGKLPFYLSLNGLSSQLMEEIDTQNRELKAEIDQDIDIMTARITNQLSLSNDQEEIARAILECAVYGNCYGKFSIHTIKESSWDREEYEDGSTGEWEEIIEEKEFPRFQQISVWDIFRSLEDSDLQKCSGIIHRVMTSPYELKDITGEGYIPEAIKRAIQTAEEFQNAKEEGNDNFSPLEFDVENRDKSIRLLEYWGRVPRKAVEEFERHASQDEETYVPVDYEENDGDEIEVLVVLANDIVIRLLQVDPEDRPFFGAIWEHGLSDTHGTSVADNMKEPQALLNGAVRGFEDNKRLTTNAIFAIKRELLLNQLDDIALRPGLTIDIAEDCEDVRQAIQQLVFQDVGESLMSMIELALQFADDESNIPRIQQGGQATGQETAFELSQRLEKSGKYIGSVIRNFDQGYIKPIASWFLKFNMEDETLEEGKDDYRIQANGFTSFSNKVTKLAGMRQALELVQGDEELKSQVKYIEIFKEFTEMLDIDTDRWFKNDQDNEADAEAQKEQAELNKMMQELEIDKIEAQTRYENAKADRELANIQLEIEKLKVAQQEVQNQTRQADEKNVIESEKLRIAEESAMKANKEKKA